MVVLQEDGDAFQRAQGFSGLAPGVGIAGVGEDVRMSAQHLVTDGRHHVIECEAASFLRHPRVEHDLKQEVAEFILEFRHVRPLDGVRHLIGFLDRVGSYGGEGLLKIPGAAAVRISEARHDLQEVVYRAFS